MNRLMEWAGWYGAIAIVGAYAAVSFSFLNANSIWYQVLNGTGAVGIVILSLHKRAYQPVVLNLIWTIIAVFAIVKIVAL